MGGEKPPYQTWTPAPRDELPTDQNAFLQPSAIAAAAEQTNAPLFESYHEYYSGPLTITNGLGEPLEVESQPLDELDWYLTNARSMYQLYSASGIGDAIEKTLEESKWHSEEEYEGFRFWSLKKDRVALRDDVAIYGAGNMLNTSVQSLLEAFVDASRGDRRFADDDERFESLCDTFGSGLVVRFPGRFQEAKERDPAYADKAIGFGMTTQVDGDTASVTRAIVYDTPADVPVDALRAHVADPEMKQTAEMYESFESTSVSKEGPLGVVESSISASEVTTEHIQNSV